MKDELLQRIMADLGWLAEQIGEQPILQDYSYLIFRDRHIHNALDPWLHQMLYWVSAVWAKPPGWRVIPVSWSLLLMIPPSRYL